MEHVQRLIAVLPKHKPESLRVLMVRLHRFIFFDIRWYEIEDATGNQVMTKQGITIGPDMLPKLIKALQEAEAAGKAEESNQRMIQEAEQKEW